MMDRTPAHSRVMTSSGAMGDISSSPASEAPIGIDDPAAQVLAAIGTDPTQGFILLSRSGRPRWSSPMLAEVFDLDLAAGNPLLAAMHPDDVELVLEIFDVEQRGPDAEAVELDRRFELLVRLRSPRGEWRWIALRLHNRLDDPAVQGMVLQLTLANQERSTVEAFDAAALGAPTSEVVEQVLGTLVSGGSGDTQAVVFDLDGRCAASTRGSGMAVGDRSDSDRWRRISEGRIGVVAEVTGPRGAPLGTLVTVSNFSDVRPFTRSLTVAVARRVGLVLESANDREELGRQVISDPLTGLHNRRFLYDHLERDDLGRWVSIAFIDLDGFKEINDRLGHHVGDDVLIEVADRLRSLQRPGDVVARLGGDEFVILRHGDDAPSSALDRDAIAAVIDHAIEVRGQRVALTASVGVATAPAERRLDVMLEADSEMYRSKTMRRPRVTG